MLDITTVDNLKVRPTDSILGGNKWSMLVESDPDGEAYGYTYTIAPHSNNAGVAVLPYRYSGDQIEVLGRFEWCPAHDASYANDLASITGGCDKKEKTPSEVAADEAYEEGGFVVQADKLISLGSVRPSKASSYTTYLYAVDVTGLEWKDAPGDGTVGEEGAYCDFVSITEAIWSKDPLLAAMVVRLMHKNSIYQSA
jgi:8-oxo-dGTP pyrophosphatase MutT (NUDIX family)